MRSDKIVDVTRRSPQQQPGALLFDLVSFWREVDVRACCKGSGAVDSGGSVGAEGGRRQPPGAFLDVAPHRTYLVYCCVPVFFALCAKLAKDRRKQRRIMNGGMESYDSLHVIP